MKFWVISVSSSLLLLSILAAGTYLGFFFAEPFTDLKGQEIEATQLRDFSGNTHSFDSLLGEVNVVYFFTSYCGPCVNTIEKFSSLQSEGMDLSALQLVALEDDQEALERFVRRTDYQGEVWIAEAGVMLLQQRRFGNEARAVPHIVLLSRDNRMIAATNKLDNAEDYLDFMQQQL